jgi:hypothetical protein
MSMCQRYQRCRRRCFVGAVPIWTNTYKPSSSATELPCAWARYGHVNTDAFSTRRCAWSCKDIKMISPGPLDEFVISICARSCTNYCWVFTKIPTKFSMRKFRGRMPLLKNATTKLCERATLKCYWPFDRNTLLREPWYNHGP